MKMKMAKIAGVLLLAAVALASCSQLLRGGSEAAGLAQVRVNAPNGRAIADEEKASARLVYYFNDKKSESNETVAPVGSKVHILVDALVDGTRIARGEETIRVQAGVNNVVIRLRENREQSSGELKGTPQIGSIIMKDGSLRTSADIGSDTANAIAVVYKVAGGKAWAVGKEISGSKMKWVEGTTVQGYQKIERLIEGNGYSDGSTGLAILRAAVSDADDANLATNYPAWDYACNYGTKQNLTNFQTGWYLPSKQELLEVYNQKDNMPSSLLNFVTDYYWCSSQSDSYDYDSYTINFYDGDWSNDSYRRKSSAYGYVCAVRQFTY